MTDTPSEKYEKVHLLTPPPFLTSSSFHQIMKSI